MSSASSDASMLAVANSAPLRHTVLAVASCTRQHANLLVAGQIIYGLVLRPDGVRPRADRGKEEADPDQPGGRPPLGGWGRRRWGGRRWGEWLEGRPPLGRADLMHRRRPDRERDERNDLSWVREKGIFSSLPSWGVSGNRFATHERGVNLRVIN
jgi:hypothetical protein